MNPFSELALMTAAFGLTVMLYSSLPRDLSLRKNMPFAEPLLMAAASPLGVETGQVLPLTRPILPASRMIASRDRESMEGSHLTAAPLTLKVPLRSSVDIGFGTIPSSAEVVFC